MKRKTSRKKDEEYRSRIFVSNPIPIKERNPDKIRLAELEFNGLVHNKESFEARVFLNNPEADHHTPKTAKNGYAGSLFVFGHGSRCWGGPGHCQVKERSDAYDLRSSPPSKPTDSYLPITKGIKEICRTKEEVTVTIVPIMMSFDEMADETNVLNFSGLALNIHNK